MTGDARQQGISLKHKLLHRLAHPVWWEDIIPGAMQATPRIIERLVPTLLRILPTLSTQVSVWVPIVAGTIVDVFYSTTEQVGSAVR